jgi:hypothetical protein
VHSNKQSVNGSQLLDANAMRCAVTFDFFSRALARENSFRNDETTLICIVSRDQCIAEHNRHPLNVITLTLYELNRFSLQVSSLKLHIYWNAILFLCALASPPSFPGRMRDVTHCSWEQTFKVISLSCRCVNWHLISRRCENESVCVCAEKLPKWKLENSIFSSLALQQLHDIG